MCYILLYVCRIEGGLDPWIEKLFESLLALFPLPLGCEILPPGRLRPSRVIMTSLVESKDVSDAIERNEETSHFVTLKMNRRITSDDWFQDVRHMEFELDSDVEYVLLLYTFQGH